MLNYLYINITKWLRNIFRNERPSVSWVIENLERQKLPQYDSSSILGIPKSPSSSSRNKPLFELLWTWFSGRVENSNSWSSSSYRSCSRRWNVAPSKSAISTLSLKVLFNFATLSKDPSDTCRGMLPYFGGGSCHGCGMVVDDFRCIVVNLAFLVESMDDSFLHFCLVRREHRLGSSRKKNRWWYAPLSEPLWILWNPQRFNWRWKDLYLVWLKNCGRISDTKIGISWTLNAFPLLTHDAIFSLPFTAHDRSISCSFHGKRTMFPPREGLLVGRAWLEMIAILGLDGDLLIVLIGAGKGLSIDFDFRYDSKIKLILSLIYVACIQQRVRRSTYFRTYFRRIFENLYLENFIRSHFHSSIIIPLADVLKSQQKYTSSVLVHWICNRKTNIWRENKKKLPVRLIKYFRELNFQESR